MNIEERTGFHYMVECGEALLDWGSDPTHGKDVGEGHISDDGATDHPTPAVQSLDVGGDEEGHTIRPGYAPEQDVTSLEDQLDVESEDE